MKPDKAFAVFDRILPRFQRDGQTELWGIIKAMRLRGYSDLLIFRIIDRRLPGVLAQFNRACEEIIRQHAARN
jgi:hypothetical protein